VCSHADQRFSGLVEYFALRRGSGQDPGSLQGPPINELDIQVERVDDRGVGKPTGGDEKGVAAVVGGAGGETGVDLRAADTALRLVFALG